MNFPDVTRKPLKGHGDVDGIANTLQAGTFGVRIPAGAGDFSFPKRPNRLWGPLSLMLQGSIPGIKRP